jgi:hypothetical protein
VFVTFVSDDWRVNVVAEVVGGGLGVVVALPSELQRLLCFFAAPIAMPR